MRAPIRPLSGAWPAGVERRLRRFFRPDPKVLLDRDVSPERFRAAMSAMHVGSTIKITDRDRHPVADDLLLEHVDLTDATIVDLGASDGTTSLDLLRRLPTFGAYVVADLYLHVTVARVLGHVVFHDEEGRCVVVAGRWWAAWPSGSPAVALLCRPFEVRARRQAGSRTQVLLLNPELVARITADRRVTYRRHDVFQPWPQPLPDVVKVANVLRRVYFTPEEIARALGALFAGLPEGGHLLVVDDGHRYGSYVHDDRHTGSGARAGLYRRSGDRFAVVAETASPPEIADQVRDVRAGAAARQPGTDGGAPQA